MSNEHDDVDGTPEDITSAADAGAEETTPSAPENSAVPDIDPTPTDTDLPGAHPFTGAAVHDADDAGPADAELDGVQPGDAEPADVVLDDSDDGDGSDGELVAVGATAGSARAAARRSVVKSGVSEKKGRATLAQDDDERQERANAFQRLGRFLREVVAELRKVIWPNKNQLVTYTIVVLVFVVFMTALVFGLDALFARGVLAVFGGGS